MQLINTDTGTYTEKIHFSPLNITKLSEIAKKLKECPYALCDYTTGGLLFGIRELYSPEISEVNDHIFLSVKEDDGKRKFLMPISKDSERSLLLLKEYTDKNNIPLTFTALTESAAQIVSKVLGTECYALDEGYDYVYDANSLAYLTGSGYHTQRTNIRKLEREHGAYVYEPLCEDNREDALSFWRELFEDSVSEHPQWKAGVEITHDAIAYSDLLGLEGGVLYVEGKVCAVAVGSIKNEMLYIHVLRASREIAGAWNLMCREFVLSKIGRIKYVNMEDDLSDAGIRRMKMSYRPIRFLYRYET